MQIQSCLSAHDHIAKCYDMVVRQGTNKTRYDIFYELASFDLRKLFNGPLDSEHAYGTYKKENPGHFEGIEFSHLLQQAGCLAAALHALHDESYHPDEGKVCLAHNDLKPDNILVFHQPGSPVGTWKIADLGLSRIKKSGNREDSMEQYGTSSMSQLNLQQPAARFAPTYAKRPPGAYTAPENQKGMRVDPIQGDIWSFGCILSEILAFAIGGTQTLREFNLLRYDHNDRFYERCAQSPTGYRLKQKVFNWLSNIHVLYPTIGIWATECVDLIFRILGVHDADAKPRYGTTGWILFLDGRPKASEIRDTISLIRKTELRRQSLQETLSLRGTSDPSKLKSITPSINITPAEPHQPEVVAAMQSSSEAIPEKNVQEPRWSSSDVAPTRNDRVEHSNHSDSRSSSASTHSGYPERILTRRPSTRLSQGSTNRSPTPPTSISTDTSASSWNIGLFDPSLSSSVKISNKGMPNTKISPNAKYVAFWSTTKAVLFCLASLKFATGQDVDHSLGCEVHRPGSSKCEAITFWGDQLAVIYRGGGAAQVHFYNLSVEDTKCHAELQSVLTHVDLSDLVEVILGTEGARVLHLSSSVRVGNGSQTLEQYRKLPINGALGEVSVTLDGKWLMAWSWSKRPNKEHWQVWELSASQRMGPVKTDQWPMAHSDTDRDASPALTIQLRSAIAKYYKTGNVTIFDKDKKSAVISQLPREVIAAYSAPGQDTLFYITAGSFLKNPLLHHMCIQSTSRGLVLKDRRGNICKMSKAWKNNPAPSFAIGEIASSSGIAVPVMLISSADGTIQRVPSRNSLDI